MAQSLRHRALGLCRLWPATSRFELMQISNTAITLHLPVYSASYTRRCKGQAGQAGRHPASHQSTHRQSLESTATRWRCCFCHDGTRSVPFSVQSCTIRTDSSLDNAWLKLDETDVVARLFHVVDVCQTMMPIHEGGPILTGIHSRWMEIQLCFGPGMFRYTATHMHAKIVKTQLVRCYTVSCSRRCLGRC